jgi:hypothetical protein
MELGGMRGSFRPVARDSIADHQGKPLHTDPLQRAAGALATALHYGASMSRYAWSLLLLAGLGCAGARTDPGDPPSPFAVVCAEYTVPIAVGKALPGTVGGWSHGASLWRWLQGWTHKPVSHDTDAPVVNYGLHPLAGSDTHLLARAQGWSYTESFLFDEFSSFSWEYVFENVYERPSLTDLMVTAPLGSMLGEVRYQMKEAGVLPWLVDPLGGKGKPFVELDAQGFLIGLERRF